MPFIDDPSTGNPFEVNRRDMSAEEAAEQAAYSPFTGDRLEPEDGAADDGEEPEEPEVDVPGR